MSKKLEGARVYLECTRDILKDMEVIDLPKGSWAGSDRGLYRAGFLDAVRIIRARVELLERAIAIGEELGKG